MSIRISNRGLGAISALGVLGLLLLPSQQAFADELPPVDPAPVVDEAPAPEPAPDVVEALVVDDVPAAIAAPATVEVYWAMPAGASDTNVLWPQTYVADPDALACGTWYQVDTYLESEAPGFYADGVLTLGEDYSSKTQTGAISWRFVDGGRCSVELTQCPDLTVLPVATEADPRGWGDTKGGTWTTAGLQLTATADAEAYAYLDFVDGIPLSSSIGSLDTVYENLVGSFGVIIHTDKGNVHYDADGRYWLVTPGLLPETSPGFYSSYDLTDLEQDALIDEVAVWVNPGGSLLLQSQEYPCAVQPFVGDDEPVVEVPPATTALLAHTGPDELRTLLLAGGALTFLLAGAAGLLYRARARRLPLAAITGTD